MEIENDKKLREEAMEHYKYFINLISGEELKAEYERVYEEAFNQNILLLAPDFDDNSDGDITMN